MLLVIIKHFTLKKKNISGLSMIPTLIKDRNQFIQNMVFDKVNILKQKVPLIF